MATIVESLHLQAPVVVVVVVVYWVCVLCRYRKWDLGSNIKVVARCKLDAYMHTTTGEALVNIKACNEWDSKVCHTHTHTQHTTRTHTHTCKHTRAHTHTHTHTHTCTHTHAVCM